MTWTLRPVYGLWNRSVAKPLAGLPLEDASAETIALSVALGLVFGMFPVYGCPTLLCAAAAIVLRLNFTAVQLVNYLISPLQLALLVPFNRVGAGLFPAHGPRIVHADNWRLLSNFWTAAMHAIVGWFCVCAPLGILLYFTLGYILRRRPCGGFLSVLGDCDVGQPLMAAAAFRGGSALDHGNRSDCCKAGTRLRPVDVTGLSRIDKEPA